MCKIYEVCNAWSCIHHQEKLITIHLIFEHMESDNTFTMRMEGKRFWGVNKIDLHFHGARMIPLNKCQERVMVGCEKNYYGESRGSKSPEGHDVSYHGV